MRCSNQIEIKKGERERENQDLDEDKEEKEWKMVRTI